MKQHLKQRLLGATVIVSLAVIFLPAVFDGEGYRQLSRVEIDVPERPHISFEQNFPELPERTPAMVFTREQVDAADPPAVGDWFVRVADFDDQDAAASLVKRLSDGGYKAAYRLVAKEGGQTFKVEVNTGGGKAGAKEIAARIRKEYDFKASPVRR